jgi:hypothetical protein
MDGQYEPTHTNSAAAADLHQDEADVQRIERQFSKIRVAAESRRKPAWPN